MQKIQELLAEANYLRNRRENLAQNLGRVDRRQREKMRELEHEHTSKLNGFEKECQMAIVTIETHAKKAISDYVQMKSDLQKYVEPARRWCPKSELKNYDPTPACANEVELNQLISMLQEQGAMAGLKRMLRVGNYSLKSEMALSLCKKIEDACAYYNNRIDEIETEAERERSAQMTETRRKITAENERFINERGKQELKYKDEKEQALLAISRFDTSTELQNMHAKLEQMKIEAKNSCGIWGEYSAPTAMPEKVLICNARVALPNQNGIRENVTLPMWVNLYECNIIVITSELGDTSSKDGEGKKFIREFLARMLKTVPPGFCSYSIFDSLYKGASLERLIDVMNIGATDLNFDLFTSNENDMKVVSCAERRKYLRSRLAETIKFIAGRDDSLFEHNKNSEKFEFPFTWYIDFNFPDAPDNKLLDDLKELLINAYAAGYSFVFMTTLNGYKQIQEITNQYTHIQIIHVDVDKAVCEKGDIQVAYTRADAPSSDQICNFMTALKKYYEEGNAINNRIDSVFNTVELRDASKKLTIPMALDSRGQLVDLELGGEGSVHGFISGGTNSGKSTLLHTIILSACLHYHPKDLEIWLVDYKQTEFYLYKRHTPPHIKLIGVSKTSDFTFSLLDKIEIEASRRTELMNRFEAQNLGEYRKHENEPGYVNIPRLFIIVDEFHEMSQFVSTEMEYKDKLENILREYRAQGINWLIADQTFSTGLSGLTAAAKNQIGLRIAMRNETAPQEIRDTLEVDRALYSDSMQRAIKIMSQGEFIMKSYIRNSRGEITDIKLEKFKGIHSRGEDIAPIGSALCDLYRGQYQEGLLYVNTKEQVSWNDAEPKALDRLEPLRYPNIRMYLGRSATLRPCFGLDMGRQPDENLAIVGGTAYQRWEILASIMKSCEYGGHKLIVFSAEYSDLMCDYSSDIGQMCQEVPGAEMIETLGGWCEKLEELDGMIDEQKNTANIICMFVGLEIANIEIKRLPAKNSGFNPNKYGTRVGGTEANTDLKEGGANNAYDATPLIDKLFSSGARNGIHCIVEVSVYRQFSGILHIKDMCRHKIAFSMSADDCLMYLGNSNFQKSIGQDAIYNDGGKEIKKLLPYKLQ